jgi:hypothetical protein
MRKPKRHRPRHNVNSQPTPQKQTGSATKAPVGTSWTIANKIVGLIITVAGLGAAIATFWPRISVDESGTFENPASIVFGATNNGLLPLRNPSLGILICYLSYGPQPQQLQPHPCKPSPCTPHSRNGRGEDWWYTDEKYTTRLEDFITITNTPITVANLLFCVGYYPWYSPYRLYKYFGFTSDKGSDGRLYWRRD